MTISQQPWATAQPDVEPTPIREGSDQDIVRALVVDLDEVARARITGELRPLQHIVFSVDTPEAAIEWLKHQDADVLVLFSDSGDVALDDAQSIRTVTEIPLIVVGPAASAESRVGAFDHGAEDYIASPVFPAELDRRIRVLVRRERLRRHNDQLAGPGELLMQVRSHEVYVADDRLALTPKEFSILKFLLEYRGEVVAPDQISLAIWGYETYGSRNYVEAHISRLRGKLSQAGVAGAIKTVRGVGYVIR